MSGADNKVMPIIGGLRYNVIIMSDIISSAVAVQECYHVMATIAKL